MRWLENCLGSWFLGQKFADSSINRSADMVDIYPQSVQWYGYHTWWVCNRLIAGASVNCFLWCLALLLLLLHLGELCKYFITFLDLISRFLASSVRFSLEIVCVCEKKECEAKTPPKEWKIAGRENGQNANRKSPVQPVSEITHLAIIRHWYRGRRSHCRDDWGCIVTQRQLSDWRMGFLCFEAALSSFTVCCRALLLYGHVVS